MIHPDELAIIKAARTHPEEDTPRLMYADWLEEHDRHGEAGFIRRHRVGEARQQMKQKALDQTFHVADHVFEEDEYERSHPSHVAESGDHQTAKSLHDEKGYDYLDQESIDPEGYENTAEDRHHSRLAAAEHFHAAHLHEAVHQDVGSPADHQSHRAYKATNKAFDGTARNSPRRTLYHLHASEAHRLASVLHEREGNETTANRHKEMADLHHREADDR